MTPRGSKANIQPSVFNRDPAVTTYGLGIQLTRTNVGARHIWSLGLLRPSPGFPGPFHTAHHPHLRLAVSPVADCKTVPREARLGLPGYFAPKTPSIKIAFSHESRGVGKPSSQVNPNPQEGKYCGWLMMIGAFRTARRALGVLHGIQRLGGAGNHQRSFYALGANTNLFCFWIRGWPSESRQITVSTCCVFSTWNPCPPPEKFKTPSEQISSCCGGQVFRGKEPTVDLPCLTKALGEQEFPSLVNRTIWNRRSASHRLPPFLSVMLGLI